MSFKKVKILPAKRKDRHEMKAINEECLPENYTIEFWEMIISYHNSFIVRIDSYIAGYCLCDDKGIICSFAILPKYRGVGFGERLLSTTLEHLGKKYKQSILQVRVSNEKAINLYNKHGFKVNKTLSKYYGDDEDAFEMIKIY